MNLHEIKSLDLNEEQMMVRCFNDLAAHIATARGASEEEIERARHCCGIDFSNDTFEMRRNRGDDCDCGQRERRDLWLEQNWHEPTCFIRQYRDRQRLMQAEIDRLPETLPFEERRRLVDSARAQLSEFAEANGNGWVWTDMLEFECDCICREVVNGDHPERLAASQAAYEVWSRENEHAAECPGHPDNVRRPLFRCGDIVLMELGRYVFYGRELSPGLVEGGMLGLSPDALLEMFARCLASLE